MSNEEFQKCFTVSSRDIRIIQDDLEKKNITDLKSKINYVKNNYYGQLFMNYALKELDDVILLKYSKIKDEFVFSEDAIDGILRAFFFATELLQARLPQHSYDYMISKSSTFFMS